MAITKDEVSKEIKLNIPKDIPDEVASDIKDEAGEFVRDSILDYVGDGRSPVDGQKFKQLSKQYADEEKGGRRVPNLDLEGDMLNALIYEKTKGGINVGIFDSSEAIKAYGHITGFEGHPWLEGVAPARPFIPGTKGTFTGKIMDGVQEIVDKRVKEYRADNPPEEQVRARTRRGPVEDEGDIRDRVATDRSALDRLISSVFGGE